MKLKRMFMGLIMALIYLLTICINVSAYGEISSKEADLTISNLKELVAFRDSVNNGNTYEGKTVKLLKDIDMSSIDNWEPIGSGVNFLGTFDGRNRTISNMTITDSNKKYACGLFGATYATEINDKWIGATIKNLNMKNVNITSSSYNAGAIVGVGEKTNIINCSAQGTIISNDGCTGGIVGFGQYANINNCKSFVNITSKDNNIGGIVGSGNYCTIKNSSVGAVNITGGHYIGGLIGFGNYINEISNCKSSANVSGYRDAGGLVGWFGYYSNIDNSNSDGNVTGTYDIGGLVGYQNYGLKITDCYSTGNVNGTSAVGGLVGYSNSAYSYNCYATGDVTGEYAIGGLVGSSNSDNIVHCHTYNDVIGKSDIGGLVGGSGSSKIINCNSASNASGEYYIGGIVGDSGNDIFINCYSNGNVSFKKINNNSTSFYDFGGFAGAASNCRLYNCYSSGNASGISYIGDYIGLWVDTLTNQNCYYNSESVGRPYGEEQQEINRIHSYTENGAPTGMSLTSMKNQSFAFELNGPIPEDIAKMLKENNITVYKYNWKQGENNNLPFIDSTLPY